MDIEDYARRHPNLFHDECEPHLEEWLSRRAFATLLDVGCGDGNLLGALQARGFLEGRQATGVDLSQHRVEQVAARFPQVEARVDDAETLASVPAGTIDFLVSTQVLEHVDDDRMLDAVARVLSPDGVAYVSTVFKRPWARFIWRTQDGSWGLDPTHLREYEADEQVFGTLPGKGLVLVDTRKTPVAYPLLDFVVRRLRLADRFLDRPVARRLRRLRVRIPGYYVWSFVLRRG